MNTVTEHIFSSKQLISKKAYQIACCITGVLVSVVFGVKTGLLNQITFGALFGLSTGGAVALVVSGFNSRGVFRIIPATMLVFISAYLFLISKDVVIATPEVVMEVVYSASLIGLFYVVVVGLGVDSLKEPVCRFFSKRHGRSQTESE